MVNFLQNGHDGFTLACIHFYTFRTFIARCTATRLILLKCLSCLRVKNSPRTSNSASLTSQTAKETPTRKQATRLSQSWPNWSSTYMWHHINNEDFNLIVRQHEQVAFDFIILNDTAKLWDALFKKFWMHK